MSAIKSIKEYLNTIPKGQPFKANILRPYGTTENIRQILNRLVKAGKLVRVARGVFSKPNHLSKIGKVNPSAIEITEVIAKSGGETIAIHGAEAARQLHLTTQVPMQQIYYTSGNSRKLKISNRVVQLKHVNPSKLANAGTASHLVISALSYLGKKNVTLKTIELIKNQISEEDFNKTLQLTENMPAWMSDIFYRFQGSKKNGV